MTCSVVELPDGTRAIICGPKPRAKKCVKCGQMQARRLCDWKLKDGKTCDAPLCAKCTSVPAPDKDLCPAHADAWAWDARHGGP